MRPHQTVTGLFIAGMAGNNYISTVYPNPHIPSRYEKRIAVMAILPSELLIDPDPLTHCNPACDFYITIATFRIWVKFHSCLFKQDLNTLPCNLSCRRVTGFLLHLSLLLLAVVIYHHMTYKRNGDFFILARTRWD
jgi:hypothetical protein